MYKSSSYLGSQWVGATVPVCNMPLAVFRAQDSLALRPPGLLRGGVGGRRGG